MDSFMNIHKKYFDMEEKIENIFEKYELLYFALKYAIENDENICSLSNLADDIYGEIHKLQAVETI